VCNIGNNNNLERNTNYTTFYVSIKSTKSKAYKVVYNQPIRSLICQYAKLKLLSSLLKRVLVMVTNHSKNIINTVHVFSIDIFLCQVKLRWLGYLIYPGRTTKIEMNYWQCQQLKCTCKCTLICYKTGIDYAK
jgi:hypothetical protein